MATSREPNPLRPYYVPPTVGPPPLKAHTNGSGAGSGGRSSARATPASKPGYGSSARDMLSDLDYSDYLSDASPSVTEMIKALMDQGLWKYTSVLFGQPFEVAKTVLQVQDAGAIEDKSKERVVLPRHTSHRHDRYEALSDDESDTDSQSYFTSSAPLPSARTPRRRFSPSRSPSPTPSRSSRDSRHRSPQSSQQASPHKHNLASASSITSALSTLWTHEGAWGVWKGTNSTFIHSVLLSTLTTFLRSLLCAVLALPDPGASSGSSFHGPASLTGIDILSSPAPLAALFATASASGLAGIILAPIDIARTKLMLTPSTYPPRSIIPALKTLKSWIVPAAIAPATFLHSILPTLISASTPLFLRSNLGIDPVLTPTTYSFASFASQAVELGVRLPIETVLRRGQMQVANDSHITAAPSRSRGRQAVPQRQEELQTVVDVGVYKGLLGTMYHIVFEEGSKNEGLAAEGLARATGTSSTARPQQQGAVKRRKGQGLGGLWRGWRVGVWGLVGSWSAVALGGGKGGEF